MSNIEFTKQELEVIVSLLSQVTIRPVSPEAVQATIMYYNLHKKCAEALEGSQALPEIFAHPPVNSNSKSSKAKEATS